MLSTTDPNDRRKLKDYLYRANYLVLKDSNTGRLSNDMKDKLFDLFLAYLEKFPIASEHVYISCINDEAGQIVESDVYPTSLLYSMPDEWQDQFCLVLDALNEIEWDDDSYEVALLDPTEQRICDDPFGDRHKRWESDTIGGHTLYPYGKD